MTWPPETVLGMLGEGTRDELISLGTPREYSTGSSLFTEGDTSNYLVALRSGWVKVIATTEEGGLSLLTLGSRGDLIGEQAALEGKPRSATVVCASVVMAYVIKQEKFMQFLASHPDAHLAVTRALSNKLRWATRRRVDFSGTPVPVRLARILSELARKNSRPTTAGTELGYALTQSEIAALVGVSEPSVQRALRTLRQDRVLTTKYRRIIIQDMSALNGIAGPDWSAG
jgi:CRP/FNR family transcriptional regulator, cyclic AMP receptor protein